MAGSHRNFGRRGPAHSAKDDVPSKRGGAVGHGLHEVRSCFGDI